MRTGIFLILSLLLAFSVLLDGCRKHDDPPEQFPSCVGIVGDFDPLQIADRYSVSLFGEDTLTTLMIFTNYTPGSIFSLPSFHLWITSSHAPGSITYADGYCYKGYDSQKWFGNSALYYNREFANCDFEFEVFTCTRVEGKCSIYLTYDPDTLYYNFEGLKR